MLNNNLIFFSCESSESHHWVTSPTAQMDGFDFADTPASPAGAESFGSFGEQPLDFSSPVPPSYESQGSAGDFGSFGKPCPSAASPPREHLSLLLIGAPEGQQTGSMTGSFDDFAQTAGNDSIDFGATASPAGSFEQPSESNGSFGFDETSSPAPAASESFSEEPEPAQEEPAKNDISASFGAVRASAGRSDVLR